MGPVQHRDTTQAAALLLQHNRGCQWQPNLALQRHDLWPCSVLWHDAWLPFPEQSIRQVRQACPCTAEALEQPCIVLSTSRR